MTASTSSVARLFTVVVGVDFSPSSDRALATARTLCKLSGGGQLHAVHAVSLVALSAGVAEAPIVCSEVEAELVAAARTRLTASVPLEGLPAGSEVTVHVETGIAATAASGGIYTRCPRHQGRRVHAHTYTDLGDAMRAPTEAFSF